MEREGLLIGEVAKRSGASRKALRLYVAAGILPAPRRTQSGYRVYSREALEPRGPEESRVERPCGPDPVGPVVEGLTPRRGGRVGCGPDGGSAGSLSKAPAP